MRSAVLLALAAALASCSAPGPREADRYYVLETFVAQPPAPAAAAANVTIGATTAATFYDTQDIVYSRGPGTRGYYQFSHWTERPQRALQALLAQRLPGGTGTAGPILVTHLEEIYHDAAQSPGAAHLTVSAQLLDASGRTVLARRTFTHVTPSASYDAPGAVQAMREALAAIVDELVDWAGQAASHAIPAS